MGFFALMAIGSLYEYYGMMKAKGLPIMWLPGYALLLWLWALPLLAHEALFLAGLMVIVMVAVIHAVLQYPKIRLPELAMNLFGPFYLGITLQYALRILDMAEPFNVIFFVFLLTWASDIGGYAAGVLWGKNKLAPHLSPNKTKEGSIGSMLLCLIVAIGFASLVEIDNLGYAYFVIIGFSASVGAQLGDLFMSSLKRYFEVKDTGFIIPGHGGILDRFDSFLLVLPLVYYGVYYVV